MSSDLTLNDLYVRLSEKLSDNHTETCQRLTAIETQLTGALARLEVVEKDNIQCALERARFRGASAAFAILGTMIGGAFTLLINYVRKP